MPIPLFEGRLAVVAPCGPFNPDRFAAGLALAEAAGLQLEPLPGLLQPHRYLAAHDDHRAEQLIEALTADRYAGVWIARGGYGLTRILDRLEGLSLPPERPVLGFSDVTALFCALHRLGCGPLIHAPVVHSLSSTDAGDRQQLWGLLRGERPGPLAGRSWIGGRAEGWLCGGNLCLLASLCGTPWQLDATGAILVLEEVGEPPYRVDRMLQQLRSAGVLDGVAGIAVGELVGCAAPEGADWSIHDVIREHLAPLGVPVVGELPIGHGARNRPFAWGAPAQLGDGTLTWSPPLHVS
ncbi:MAG TPA: LD-carboxypeptidase [Deltaproteobacteria bacterium]|nr:LD-carboxypeptidase [Deltaproteobacteria bacterium]